MAKLMIFIDGSWLYKNLRRLADEYGRDDYRVDFGKLPHVLGERVGKQLGLGAEIDIVRTYLFASYPVNFDVQDEVVVEKQLDFFYRLKEEFHYELQLFPINFAGRRLSRRDRDPGDSFQPKEKCVDIALATHMLYFAAIPYAFDIAVAVIGDQDFKPVLQHVRRLGKRIAIASIKGSCTPDYSDPRDEARVKDFDIIWINDHLAELELKFEPHQLECQSPMHQGPRLVWTTYYPRKDEKFYCDECREAYRLQRAEAEEDAFGDVPRDAMEKEPGDLQGGESEFGDPTSLEGVVSHLVEDRGYGFLETDSEGSFFFHLRDLARGVDFSDIELGDRFLFDVKTYPSEDRAGSARNVRRVADG